jgi:hypothetical protein
MCRSRNPRSLPHPPSVWGKRPQCCLEMPQGHHLGTPGGSQEDWIAASRSLFRSRLLHGPPSRKFVSPDLMNKADVSVVEQAN